MADETRLFLALALLALLAAPALGDEAAPGERGGGDLPLGGEGTDNGSITITAPTNITGWSLRPGQENTQEGTLKVTASGAWSVSVSDADGTTGGKMTEYWTINDTYVSSDPAKLGAFMLVKATGTHGTGTNVTLPTGGQIASNSSAVSNAEIPITFTQPISWTDQVSKTGRGYKIVITFMGSAA